MTVDTTKLRELAQAATPGPWYSKWPEERCAWKDIGHSRYPVAYTGDCFDDAPNAEFIAAANPATVLALLDDLEHLRVSTANQSQTIARLQKVERAMHQGEKVGCRCTYTDNRVIDTECEYHRAIRAERDRLRTIEAAARNLVKVKGRHNSEIAMNRLQATLAASE